MLFRSRSETQAESTLQVSHWNSSFLIFAGRLPKKPDSFFGICSHIQRFSELFCPCSSVSHLLRAKKSRKKEAEKRKKRHFSVRKVPLVAFWYPSQELPILNSLRPKGLRPVFGSHLVASISFLLPGQKSHRWRRWYVQLSETATDKSARVEGGAFNPGA